MEFIMEFVENLINFFTLFWMSYTPRGHICGK